jgi:beta-lactamase regulating signal transducer with metallopeptidase domain
MKSLLFYFLQVIVCSGILYGYYFFALRNRKFHRYNRYYLLFAAAVSLVIPAFNIPVYFQAKPSSEFLQALSSFSSFRSETVAVTEGDKIAITTFYSWENISKLIYLLVASAVLLRLLIALLRINKLIRSHLNERIDHLYFINTEEPGTPFSFLNWLFWNKKIDLTSETGAQIFRHELFHIRQKHSLDIIFFELLAIIFWANPFFHVFKKEIRAIHEFLADEFAMKENEEWSYAELLLMQLLESRNHLLNPFFHTQIKRRIAMITSSKKSSYTYLRKLLVLPIVAIVMALFAFKYKNKQYLMTSIVEKQNIDTIPKTGSKRSFFYSHPDKLILEADTLIHYPHPNTCKIDLKKALIIINGQKKGTEILKKKTIISDKITFFSKDDHMTIEKFGKEGQNGVIVFENAVTINTPPSEYYKNDLAESNKLAESDKIFEKVEIDASFPGGEAAWRNFVSNNLKKSIPTDKDAPGGTYTVWLQFIVDKEGNIIDIRALTSHGYGMEEESLRLMRSSPKWIPAKQNGHVVKAYRKQPITFVVDRREKDSITILNPVNNSNLTTLYVGVRNRIAIKVDGVSPENIVVRLSSGSGGLLSPGALHIEGNNGFYTAKVSFVGAVLLAVYSKENGIEKKLAEKTLQTRG